MTIQIPDSRIQEIMQEVIDKFLIPKFISLGMNASGQWISSLQARAESGRGEIWGMDYTRYLVNGRAPGKRPPIQPLVQWVGYKFGLSGQEATGAAFAIANKIAKEGTDYYPNGTDLLEVLQSPDVTQYIYDSAQVELVGVVSAEIKRNLQTLFA